MNTSPAGKMLKLLTSGFRWVDRHSAIWVFVLAGLALTSASCGIAIKHFDSIPSVQDEGFALALFNWVSDCLYEAVQVLLLNMASHEDDFNFCIGCARVFGVAFFGLVAIQAIRRLFSRSFSEFRLRTRTREIAFVAGLGRLGLQIALEESKKGRLVVVQEPNENNSNRAIAAEAGVIVLTEDGSDIDALREHIQRSPKTIHLVTGDDLTNMNALANVIALRKELVDSAKSRLGPCECFIHVEHAELHGSFSRCLSENQDDFDPNLKIHAFNLYHETACQLIIDELTPLRPLNDKEVALYVVFGFEQMGMAMVKELAEFAHFENLKRSRILVVSDDAERDYRKCVSHWPRMCPRVVQTDLKYVQFDKARDDWGNQSAEPAVDSGRNVDPKAIQYAANVQFCQLRAPGILSYPEVAELVRVATQPGVQPVFLFCNEADSDNFRMASELEDWLQDNHGLNKSASKKQQAKEETNTEPVQGPYLPIYAFLPRSQPLRAVLKTALKANPAAVRPFGDVQQGLMRAHDSFVEEVAFEIAYDYHVNETKAKIEKQAAEQASREARPNPEQEQAEAPRVEELRILTRDEFLRELRSKPYWEQASNLCAAEHKRLLIQLMGYKIAHDTTKPGTHSLSFSGLSEKDKETLARVEHNRWMAERLLIGWCHGPRNNHPPQRISFCVEKHLDLTDWQKDFRQIAHTLKLLETRKVFFEKLPPRRRPLD